MIVVSQRPFKLLNYSIITLQNVENEMKSNISYSQKIKGENNGEMGEKKRGGKCKISSAIFYVHVLAFKLHASTYFVT